ncbi:MAG TPA: prenyltransferase/squalene oxidase repeat-containing protein [Planctomycetota bacterium]|nr:prenyltransferase/squalene oxidase repeat-containing protein [Planctomycetota bacterium]
MRVLLTVLLFAAAARPQDITRPPRDFERDRAEAVRQGLDYLAREQRRDGSWCGSDDDGGVVGITALSVLAFLSQGHQEGFGPYAAFNGQGDVVRRAVDYLLKHSTTTVRQGKPPGFIFAEEDADSRMHGHGYATQALVLVYGTGRADAARERELKEKIRLAVKVIEDSQTITGGWGYEPNSATMHEGSVTVTVVQALRLAADAGFTVDREVQERGLKYLRDSQRSDGSFKYSHMADTSTPALTAAALTAMHGFGEYYSSSITKGLEYLANAYRGGLDRLQWEYYCHYYAAQAFYRAGGSHWEIWKQEGLPRLLAQQRREGFWDDKLSASSQRGTFGRPYATACAVLALSVDEGYLPIFQR